MTFPETESVLLNCLHRPRIGVLHFPQVISRFGNTLDLIEMSLWKDNYLSSLHADGMSPSISISKCSSVIVYLKFCDLPSGSTVFWGSFFRSL